MLLRRSEVRHKMHVKLEEARMKHDHHLARMAMANRALEFRKQQLLVRQKSLKPAMQRALYHINPWKEPYTT